ncbi:hypothetical protein SOCE26_061470 [Sorangium cellulosum]|uniref:Uncharacterized protein n=1 Tax=Sorangium cellulosum TaxID=56 RepID=A0A2L0EZG5_SORCE|nr:hypothetical protein [Sorangium cellulosum]AUX44680.1 hypothetical protein SOCE26_061470 [Sorangium cellulosum]
MDQGHSHPAPPQAPPARRPRARGRLAAWALAFGAVALASTAAAQTPAEPAAPRPPPSAPHVAPAAPGLPPGATWEEAIAAYEARIAGIERQLRLLDQAGSDEEDDRARRRRLELDLAAAEEELGEFMERTTERRSAVLMFSGLGVAILGGVALVSGVVLIAATHDRPVGADGRRDGYDEAVATALVGGAALAVGLPLYVIGKQRVRKDPESGEPAVAARLLVGPGAVVAPAGEGALGVGLRVVF